MKFSEGKRPARNMLGATSGCGVVDPIVTSFQKAVLTQTKLRSQGDGFQPTVILPWQIWLLRPQTASAAEACVQDGSSVTVVGGQLLETPLHRVDLRHVRRDEMIAASLIGFLLKPTTRIRCRGTAAAEMDNDGKVFFLLRRRRYNTRSCKDGGEIPIQID